MKILGCNEDGILRFNCDRPAVRRDSIVFSILKHEWVDSIQKRLVSEVNTTV
jgi:hypothetical protein